MTLISKGACGIGSALTVGGVAALTGGNPLAVAVAGLVTGTVSESIGEYVAESVVKEACLNPKAMSEFKKASPEVAKAIEKFAAPPAAAQAAVERAEKALGESDRLIALLAPQHRVFAETVAKMDAEKAEEMKAAAEKAENDKWDAAVRRVQAQDAEAAAAKTVRQRAAEKNA